MISSGSLRILVFTVMLEPILITLGVWHEVQVELYLLSRLYFFSDFVCFSTPSPGVVRVQFVGRILFFHEVAQRMGTQAVRLWG